MYAPRAKNIIGMITPTLSMVPLMMRKIIEMTPKIISANPRMNSSL